MGARSREPRRRPSAWRFRTWVTSAGDPRMVPDRPARAVELPSAGPAWGALLSEGGEALERLFASEQARREVGGIGKGLILWHPRYAPQQTLRRPQRTGRGRQEGVDVALEGSLERVGGGGGIEEPPLGRIGRRERAPG